MRPLRHTIPILILVPLILPALAAAADCGPDCLGLYFEETADTWCGQSAPFTTVTLYLVLSDPSMAELAGISFFIDLGGPIVLLGVSFGGIQICDTFTPGAYCHGWDPPLATSATTVLATLTVMVTDYTTPATVGLHNFGDPADDRVWVGLPDGGQVPLDSSAGAGMPMVQINGECGIVPAETSAWGALKSLYR